MGVFGVVCCVVLFVALFLLGVKWEKRLFLNKINKQENKVFSSSKYLLEFCVDILVIVLAALLTLCLTGVYTNIVENRKCITTLEQTVNLASRQIKANNSLINGFEDGTYSREFLERRYMIPTDFFETVMYDPTVVSNIDTKGQYDVIKYLYGVEVYQSRLNDLISDETASDKTIRQTMLNENREFYKALLNMQIIKMEIDKKLSAETAQQLRNTINTTNDWNELGDLVKQYDLDVPVFTTKSNSGS